MDTMPKPETREEKEIRQDLKQYQGIAAVLETDGGRALLDALKTDILADVEAVVSLWRGEEMALRAAAASLRTHLDFFRVLRNAPVNAKLAEEALSKLLDVDTF